MSGKSRKRGHRILYPGSTGLHAAFKELIGLAMPNLDDRFATMSLFPFVGSHKENNDFLRFFWPMATEVVSILWHDHGVIFPCDACCG